MNTAKDITECQTLIYSKFVVKQRYGEQQNKYLFGENSCTQSECVWPIASQTKCIQQSCESNEAFQYFDTI